MYWNSLVVEELNDLNYTDNEFCIVGHQLGNEYVSVKQMREPVDWSEICHELD